MSSQQPARIVILGGGFGGLAVARELERLLPDRNAAQITLVNRENFSLFTPMLHEVAVAGPHGIAFSPDERYLFVSDWDTRHKVIARYELRVDGALARASRASVWTPRQPRKRSTPSRSTGAATSTRQARAASGSSCRTVRTSAPSAHDRLCVRLKIPGIRPPLRFNAAALGKEEWTRKAIAVRSGIAGSITCATCPRPTSEELERQPRGLRARRADLAHAELAYPGWLKQLITHRVSGLENYRELIDTLVRPSGGGAIKIVCEVGRDD